MGPLPRSWAPTARQEGSMVLQTAPHHSAHLEEDKALSWWAAILCPQARLAIC